MVATRVAQGQGGAAAAARGDEPRGAAIEAFIESHFRLQPVSATFAGNHAFDAHLPDYSPEGLTAARQERSRLRRDLADAGLGLLAPSDIARRDWVAIDGALADASLEIELAEADSPHFLRGNPLLPIADALHGLVAIALSGALPIDVAVDSVVARLKAFPSFLHGARRSLGDGPVPASWRDRAVRTCDGGLALLADLAGWAVGGGAAVSQCRALQDAGVHASAAVDWYRAWVAGREHAPSTRYAAGGSLLDTIARRAHGAEQPVEAMRHEARASMEREVNRLHDLLRASGDASWDSVVARVTSQHPAVDNVLATCAASWEALRDASSDQVTWPGVPVRFIPMPAWARRAAPDLSWRLYRSPPPLERPDADRYHVPLPDEDANGAERERFTRTWNHVAIRLQHVLHHGGLGRHNVYRHAAGAPSRIGRLAAVDGASRMALLVGGSLVEGWAAYAIEMMEEEGVLTPDERLAAQRERVHIMVRAVVDLELHTGRLSHDRAVQFHHEVALVPRAAARAEVTRSSMFPGTGIMRWFGLRELWRARHAAESALRERFDAHSFHDAVLACGAIPVTLVSSLLAASRGATDP
jgi:hypothetical protein